MKLKISNQQVTITEALPLVSDTENVYEAEYEFDEEWEGYQRTAVYEGCGASYQVVLTNTNKCKIPNEIIADSGYVRFGVLGTKVVGSITQRYPTVWSERVWVDVASVGTGTPAPPTAEVYAQILANEDAIENRLDTAESDIDALESGKVDKVEGKGLSTNDYTNVEKQKVADAYADKHTHSNKGILDAISQTLVNAWNNASTWITDNGTNLLNHLSNGTIHVTASDKSTWNAKQNHLTAGENITIVNDVISSSGGTGVTDYDDLTNKPKINNVELSGNKSASDLGIDVPTKTSDLTNDSGFIDSSYHDSSKADASSVYTKTEIDTTVNTLQPKTDILLSSLDEQNRVVQSILAVDAKVENKSTVSVSATGSSTDEVGYITIDGIEKKLPIGGSGGSTNYNDLTNKPQIGGVTLIGNKSASDLGLVASVSGKGLSTNDYDNTEKGNVGANTSARHIHTKITLSLPTASWSATSGATELYEQTITITGSTANTKVDLQADSSVIKQLIEDGCLGLYVDNNNNVIKAYAVGEKPSVNLSVQATYSEVTV